MQKKREAPKLRSEKQLSAKGAKSDIEGDKKGALAKMLFREKLKFLLADKIIH